MFSQLFVNKTNHFVIQLFRYTFVGGIAFAADFSTLYLLTDKLHFYYLVSATVSFLFGLIINYLLSITWVFNTRTLKNRWIELALFTFIGIIGLVMNDMFIWLFTEVFHIHYLKSKIISTVFVFGWNFLARKLTLFKTQNL
jgi:putative flippase GtrA